MRATGGKRRAKAFLGLGQLLAVMGLALFASAGTWRYVEAWLYLLVYGASAVAITLDLVRNDPGLLDRRLQAGPRAERRARQKVLQAFASLAFLALLVVPGLDHRFAWSRVPIPVVALGELLVVAGFFLVSLVFRENSYASAVIEVGAGQRVIDTGPYARVRHPMYAGALVLLAGTPLALGSWWGLFLLGPFGAVLVARLRDEEAVLARELPGYEAYRRRIRYRLIPGVW